MHQIRDGVAIWVIRLYRALVNYIQIVWRWRQLSPKLSYTASELVCLDRERQFDSSTINKSTGGYSVPTIVLQSFGTLANGNQKQHVSERGSHCWENEYSSRPVEQEIFQIWEKPMIDLFASCHNKKMDIFCTWDQHP